MISRLQWLKIVFLRYYRDMGLRVLFYALLSLVATLVSPLANSLLSETAKSRIEFSSVLPVLTILASSMLAVSTFSLNIMVSAHRAAAEATTPRVHRILLENTTTQSVLAAFIGAFVYSLGSIVLYRLGFYPENAAIIVMGITTLVVVWVVISLLRWIQHLTTLGSVEDSLLSAEKRAREALLAHARHPRFGASDLTSDTVLPMELTALHAPQSGFLQLIDMGRLQNCLPGAVSIYLSVRPGMHVLTGQVIAQVSGHIDEATKHALAEVFTFGKHRTHEQDAEFGLVVLSEIASKALSPGINDPGTAIEALLTLKSLLWEFARESPTGDGISAPNVFVNFPDAKGFVDVAFAPIARDGAGTIEVAVALRSSLSALVDSGNAAMAMAACDFAETALSCAEEAGLPSHEMDQLRAIHISTTDRPAIHTI